MPGPKHSFAAGAGTAAFVLTVSLFVVWGMGHRFYDALVPLFADTFKLMPRTRAFTQGIYNVVYFLGAIPAAFYARRLGSKAAILFGLGCIAVGAFTLYPAAETHVFSYFLFAVILMSVGWIFLEIAANPLAASLGAPEHFVWRLNLAQAFYPLGALAGVFGGRWLVNAHLAMPGAKSVYAAAHPYIVIGIGMLLLAYLFEEVRFPAVASERVKGGAGRTLAVLARQPRFLFAVAAQFFCVLAMGTIWTFNDALVRPALPAGFLDNLGGSFALAMIVFAAGRIAGCALMRVLAPARVLALFALGGALCCVLAASFGGLVAAIAILGGSLFLSITWPTILGMAIQSEGDRMKPATALVCMGGAAGGMALQMLRLVWTSPSPHQAVLVAAASFAAIIAYARSPAPSVSGR